MQVLHESFAHFEAVIKSGALVQLCTMVVSRTKHGFKLKH
jgi:hypothetical protein